MPKLANLPAIHARDKRAFAIDRDQKCGFVEAWLRVLDEEEIGDLRTQNEPAEANA